MPSIVVKALLLATLAFTHLAHSRTLTSSSPNSTSTSACPLEPGEQSSQIVNHPPTWPYQVFKSSPFTPPKLQITTNGKPLAPGLLFITPSEQSAVVATSDVAPLIMTDAGQLVFNGPIVNATNFRHATYKGKDILTYWSGLSTAGANVGHGYGNVTFLDDTYTEILTVCPKFGLVTPDNTQYPCEADLHESYTTGRDTILVSAYNATPTDLTSVGGPKDGWVFDCLFFEIEPESAKILFRWSALEHVPVIDSKQPLAGTGLNQTVPWDWFHINSVVNVGNEYLVNSRHVWTTYLLTAKGDIIWRIQGDTGGDFGPLPADAHFRRQQRHPPHQRPRTPPPPPPSNTTPVVVLKDLSDPTDPIYADSQGSTEILPNGNTLMDYGQIPVLKEYGPGADVRYTARFAADDLVQSYRGFKHEWHATPTTNPSLVVEKNGTRGAGYVSWNGATEVTAWAVYEGPSKRELGFVGRVGYKGFETMFGVAEKCVQVVALVGGKTGAKSNVACT
ncbi:hypothetical protein OEA41_004111 [Lepraria neglecta]|uniref:ASST-domain-containing protein n=1 Tax=Lepraria neglecta TaxID=209136 RepID=A0AAD9Z927_9LECA|nr:hypothetical protein OEA41_004111 [Lepraria neglecta]